MTHITAVIPLLNEEKIVGELIRRVELNLKTISPDYRVILVDDGSTDSTWEEITKVGTGNSKISGIKFSRNYGHHYAITAGINNSDSDWVVVMDGDLQDRPEVIPDLYKKAQEGFDVVFVNRIERKESIIYLLVQKIFYKSLNILSGLNFNSRQANFSIISKKVAEAHKKFNENARFYASTIKWLGFSTSSINARHGERFDGKPSYTIKRRFKLAFDVIVAFSERPLKFAISIGLVLSFSSILIAIWIAVKALNSEFTVLGWPSIIFSIFFTTGVNLIILGILGIYLGRVFNEVKKRPLYIEAETVNI
jgi:glycosyltransferase involved in cell wall biosynthesis